MSSHRNRLLPALFLLLSVLVVWDRVAAHTKPHPAAPADTATAGSPAEPVAEPPQVWICPMCETVRESEPGACPICKMDLLPEVRTEAGGSVTARDRTASPSSSGVAGPAVPIKPLMPGLPNWMFYVSVIGILGLSFLLFDWWGRHERKSGGARGPRWDLFRVPGLRRLVAYRWFLPAVQLPVFALFAIVIYAGLFGNPDPQRNIAPVLTWTIWWTWLVIAIIFVGKAWCMVCPWMAFADWISRWTRSRRARAADPGLRWPRALRNIWLATGMFVGLTWLELGFGVTDQPGLTAMLGLLMVAISVVTVVFFERKAFCRYACLVGRVSGLYANFSATELRARDREVCGSCESKGCFKGTDAGDPCPTHQFMGAMDRNTYCTMCTECVKSCSLDNIAWNVRPPAADLLEQKRTRTDEAHLAVILLSMSAFHGLTMTPKWDSFVEWVGGVTGTGQLASFSLGMASMLALPFLLYFAVCLLMKLCAGDREHGVHTLFVRFSYSLLPIALFYHLAHNLQHIFYEGLKLVRIASDPFGRGWDLFGTAQMPISAVLSADVGWWIQIGLILVGHIYGILIAHRTAFALYGRPRQATLSQVPMLVAMALFSLQSVWLLSQPMLMRTAM